MKENKPIAKDFVFWVRDESTDKNYGPYYTTKSVGVMVKAIGVKNARIMLEKKLYFNVDIKVENGNILFDLEELLK